ncbi:MAG TPA: carboxypeptidase regulatory-like domain-containing protein [Egibacteraceae bacterium]|nr:carboxypeptidase regulatory-like domain-containing protein [Egibacteraceae bacterium]
MNAHAKSGAVPRPVRTLLASATALLMVSTLVAANPVSADNHFRALDAWNNYFIQAGQGTTDGVFVRWSEPITPTTHGPVSGYTIHEASDCSGEAISTGQTGSWAPGRPAIRDLTMANWAAIQTGRTYHLRVAGATERASASSATNQAECFPFVAQLRAAITGRVTDAETGAGHPDATVVAYDGNGVEVGRQATVATAPQPATIGNYSIEGLAPGTYTVTASAPGYESQSRTVEAPAGQTLGVTFALRREVAPTHGTVAGRVTAASTGAAIAGATVSAHGRTATTDGDGAYTISALDPGEYTVTVAARNFLGASQTTTVEAGRTATVDFALQGVALGRWESTGPLSVPRYDHTTTLLNNGRVLAASGRRVVTGEPVQIVSSAEVYNPQKGTWTATGALNEARWSHTATRLRDGRVLAVGGFAAPYTLTATGAGSNAQPVTSTAEIYDPDTGRWTRTGDLHTRRTLHTASLLPDGTVLVAGGRTCDQAPPAACNFTFRTNTAEIFDPSTGTWTVVGDLTERRHTTSAALLHDGTVIVPAGFSETGNSRTADIYDPATRTWRQTAGPLNVGRARQGAMLLHDGRVLVAAGFQGRDTSEIYDPATDAWTHTGTVADAGRFNFRFQVLPDGQALIAGGAVPGTGVDSSTEVYDPATGQWHSGGAMPAAHGSSSSLSKTDEAILLGVPRSGNAKSTACGPHCGKVLVAGNSTNGAVSLYTPVCPTRMPPPSQRTTCVAHTP